MLAQFGKEDKTLVKGACRKVRQHNVCKKDCLVYIYVSLLYILKGLKGVDMECELLPFKCLTMID